jgi:pyruvate dehydrogenase E2 component (dihydrolipoamide acetyltransferase)
MKGDYVVPKFVKMPRLGLTMTEGLIMAWHKKEADFVKKWESLVDIESDKSVVTFESPEEGYVLKILVPAGETAECHAVIVVLGEKGEVFDDSMLEGLAETDGSKTPSDTVQKTEPPKPQETESKPAEIKTQSQEKILSSPAARKVLKDNNLDIHTVAAQTNKTLIQKADVLSYLETIKDENTKATPLAKKIAEEQGHDLAALGKAPGDRIYSADLEAFNAQMTQSNVKREDRKFPVVGMRKVIASRMRESLETAAHISLTTEVDATNALMMRERLLGIAKERYDVKISLNDIIAKCVAITLRRHPRVNSVFMNDGIIEKGNINIGVAVALDDGLIVPVIKDCDLKSIGMISLESKKLAEKARSSGLAREDISEGTFTISNLGMFGITQFTSIINQPESAILSVAQAVKRPVVIESGEIVVRSIMNLTLNIDHRPIDGAVGAKFLKELKELIEEPYGLLL